jgi:hypothetical protein
VQSSDANTIIVAVISCKNDVENQVRLSRLLLLPVNARCHFKSGMADVFAYKVSNGHGPCLLQIIWSMAKEHDKGGERTLGVLTKVWAGNACMLLPAQSACQCICCNDLLQAA